MRRNWNRSTKLVLNASCSHGLIAQLVRASEQNSVAMGLNSN